MNKVKQKNSFRRRKLIEQKLIGFLLIVSTILVFYLASVGILAENGDVTVVLLMIPMGLYLLFTKRIVIR